VFSEANVFNIKHIVSLKEEEYQAKDIGTFLTFKYDIKWWLAYVLQVKDSEI
jgi:hypothetical protein